jgi:hypothetical protein
MSKRFKFLAAAALLLFPISTSVNSARASDATLTYQEWSASDNYSEMTDALNTLSSKITGGKGLDYHLKVTAAVGSLTISDSDIHFVTAAKQNAFLFKYVIQASNAGTNQNYSFDFGYSKGTYFGTIDTLKTLTQSTSSAMTAALKKAGASKAKYFKTTQENSTTAYMKMIRSNYTTQLSGSNLSNWNMFNANVDAPTTSFSDIEKAPNPTNPSDTDYSWEIVAPYGLSSEELTTFKVTLTLSSDGNHFTLTSEGDTPYSGLGVQHLEASTVVTYNPNLTVTTPNLKTAVNVQPVLVALYKPMLEKSLTLIAKNIVIQAKKDAAKYRKPLSGTLLMQTTKTQTQYFTALKYFNIPNGVKLSYSYQGASANVCMKVSGKTVQIKTC